jgi:lipopolysaccharide heptosyltransferase II
LRILLVRLRQIGDVVFTTPAIRALRRRFPDSRIAYIVEPAAAPVVLRNPHLDDVIVAPRRPGIRGAIDDLSLGRRLRAQQYDLAIDFHGGPRAALLTWLSGAPTRIGYEIAGRRWMYTHRVSRPRELRRRHSVENQWDLLRVLEIPPPDRTADAMEMAADPAIAAAVAERLERAGVTRGDRIAVVHVSAGNPFRRWPPQHFVALIAQLAAGEVPLRVLVTSGPSESAAAGRVIERAREALGGEAAARIVSCGEFSLAELRSLFDRAALFVGGDSGPLHVAATTRVPIVGLYGPTLPVRSEPWRNPSCRTESVEAGELPCRPCEQRVCEPGDFRCLSRIEPAQVIAACRRALGSSSQDQIECR